MTTDAHHSMILCFSGDKAKNTVCMLITGHGVSGGSDRAFGNPSYHVQALFSKHQGSHYVKTMVNASLPDEGGVAASATCADDACSSVSLKAPPFACSSFLPPHFARYFLPHVLPNNATHFASCLPHSLQKYKASQLHSPRSSTISDKLAHMRLYPQTCEWQEGVCWGL